MTNKIFIDVDTERDKQIIFGKPPDFQLPENAEDAGKMIINDIACLSEAVKYLIILAGDNNYCNKEELTNAAIQTLQSALNQENESKENVTGSSE